MMGPFTRGLRSSSARVYDQSARFCKDRAFGLNRIMLLLSSLQFRPMSVQSKHDVSSSHLSIFLRFCLCVWLDYIFDFFVTIESSCVSVFVENSCVLVVGAYGEV